MSAPSEPLAYCWPQSIAAGETVELMVSSPSADVDVSVLRIAGADRSNDAVVHEAAGVGVGHHDLADDAYRNGCTWPTALSFDTADWAPGVHLVAVRATGAEATTAPSTAWAYVVVRPGRPTNRRVLMLATNTWNAYNDVGGGNLYTVSQHQSARRPLPAGFLRKPIEVGERFANTRPGVSGLDDFLAYIARHDYGVWQAAAGFAAYEERFLRWAAAEGIGVDVVLDRDVHARPGLLDGYDMAISVGHDEYTTWEQRDALDAFVAAGRRLVFMSGNAHYWQVRIDSEGDVMTCWKHLYEHDPVFSSDDRSRLTSIWSDPLIGRPENELTGVSFVRGGYARMASRISNGTGGYTVQRPEHRLLAGTDLGYGDTLGGEHTVVGYECDGCDWTVESGRPVPTTADGTPASFQIVATSPVQPFDEASTLAPLADGGRYEAEFHADRVLGSTSAEAQQRLTYGQAMLGAWTHPSGGGVVTTGCTDWVFGLADADVAQITRNMLSLEQDTP